MRAPTVIIPVRNEGEGFENTYAELARYIPAEARVLVIYDFDEDTTVPVLDRLKSRDQRIVPVKNTVGAGIPNVLRAGFAHVEDGPVIVVMGDLSDDLRVIPEMLRLYKQGVSVVCPSRYMPGGAQHGGPLVKKILSRLAGLSLYWLGGLPVRDATNNFRLYDAHFLKNTPIESTQGFEIALELTVKAYQAGLEVREIPTVWRDREWGKSNFRLLRALPYYFKWWLWGVRRRAMRTDG